MLLLCYRKKKDTLSVGRMDLDQRSTVHYVLCGLLFTLYSEGRVQMKDENKPSQCFQVFVSSADCVRNTSLFCEFVIYQRYREGTPCNHFIHCIVQSLIRHKLALVQKYSRLKEEYIYSTYQCETIAVN